VATGPLPKPPEVPFISNPAFADCVHPGVKRDCQDGWCRIPAGCYVYGSPEDEVLRAKYDERQSRVTLTRDFEIQSTEVTQGAWLETGWPVPPVLEDVSISHCTAAECPVNRISWYWAMRYANWLSEQRGLEPCVEMSNCQEPNRESVDFSCDVTLRAASVYECEGYRLPTSAEWEYAARAGTISEFYSGAMRRTGTEDYCEFDPNLARVAWYCGNVPNALTPQQMEQPVGLLEPNAWGLYDALGNANEWVLDHFGGVSWGDPYPDPEAEFVDSGSGMTRNCPFYGGSTMCRAAARLSAPRAARLAGFRLARTLGPGAPPTLADLRATSESAR
jgi:formylglycine-generating enzyme required for sulfatase activity